MKIILVMGLVYLLTSVSYVHGYVAPRDENRVPASVICDRDGNFIVITSSGELLIMTSTNSTVQIYYDGKIAKIDSDGWLQVETSTDSRIQIYYGTHTAIVRDGSTDDNLPSEKGLLTQSNLHVYNSNKWHRLIGEATNYHNLRVALFENGRILSINDFDSDNQAEGRDGIIVYSCLSGWDEINDNWDRARMDEMKNLKVILGSNSVIAALLDSVTIYMNVSQFEELTKHTTVYLTESQWRSLKEETTTFINVSQVADLKVVSLPDGTTVYLTESQFDELNESINNIYNQLKSSVTTSDWRYANKVSTGTSGKITAITSQQIVISNEVSSFHFTFINSADGSAEATVIPSHTGDVQYYYDGFWKNIEVNIPQAIIFDVTLPVTSTMTYEIQEVRKP